MINFYSSALKNLKEKHLYRCLTPSDSVDSTTIKRHKSKLISFCCNDYFGLSHHEEVKKSAMAAIQKYGVGARASRYVTGNNSLYAKLEKQIARMKGGDDAIVFASGYVSAIGVIPALVGEGDVIVADRLIHSSLIDAAKLSGARLMRFVHNDVGHAESILKENRGKFKKCLIITETVFSMDGDMGKVAELLKLAEAFDSLLISDAAHDLFSNCHPALVAGSIGSYHLQLGTFSKAVGSLGGYVTGDEVLIDYLRNFAKSAIYSTALPPSVLAASLASLRIIEQDNLGEKALENATYFCALMQLPSPQSAIVPIIIGDNEKVLEIAKKVEKHGMLISAIRPPTVEVGKARLRITFSAMHQKMHIEKLALLLKDFI